MTTASTPLVAGLRSRRPRHLAVSIRRHAGREVLLAFALLAGIAIAPPAPAEASTVDLYETGAQSMKVSEAVVPEEVARDSLTATPGLETLAASGTNADWAKMVLLSGGWPQTDENVTVMMRWMRQENGTASWWNRNNPLNNGYGSGGGAGLGSYANLTIAAQMAAENLHQHPGYAGIVASLAASGSADATAQAIWASPWATSHYANGTHWSTRPVDVVTAPAAAWGR